MEPVTFVRYITDWAGDARLYRLPKTHMLRGYDGRFQCGYNHVIVSAAHVPFSGPETYIFPAAPNGNVKDWKELPGSSRGTWAHDEVLAKAGYEIQ
jgi:hypothetical protein